MGHDVFISYANQDKPIADAVCALLEMKTIRCWMAPRDILPGADWSESIIDGIAECRAMVLVLSKASNKSPQVKREVAMAVNEGRVVIPFRIEEIELSKHMRYFISTPHWLDAFTPPLEQHLNRLQETIAQLLKVVGEGGGDGMGGGRTAPVVLPPPRHPSEGAEGEKRSFGPDAANPYETTKLSMRVPGERGARNICLLGQAEAHLGKNRRNDIVLRVCPPTEENDDKSGLISRTHAVVELDGDQAVWHNMHCSNGTMIEGEYLDVDVDRVLHDGEAICPADVVSMACDIYYEDAMDEEGPYAAFAERLGLPAGRDKAGAVAAVRLRRTDALAGLEQYVLFRRGVWIGREPGCPILIAHGSVAERHAKLLKLGGALWIEPAQSKSETLVHGEPMPLNALVPLRPGLELQFGEVQVTIREYEQYYLDLIPSES
jgi:pSer/pThr/pTyr-binding forkhead associated (FHA) protein